ncbi:dienelactone hydrolase family protein [Comamonas sp. GB3 AK4-5]|uniref:dienelactone hydrolase family protein n=1 Tax=Comamonas sp. GB3 AK4-5 TaxID=3231487 RepID=UPI00351DB241
MSPLGPSQPLILQTADGRSLPAWAAMPDGPLRGAVVVLQEIFGVNSHIRAVTERFAARGFAALAPALFHQFDPTGPLGVELGYTEADVQAGLRLKAQAEALPPPGVQQDIHAAVDWLATTTGQKVGVVGFCWGGLLAWRAACQLPQLSAAVCYYGGGMTRPEERSRSPLCPVMAHFGRQDAHIPLDSVQAFDQVQPQAQVLVYDADHGFNCGQRGSYDDASALVARDRTLAFLDAQLGG